ncbi:vanadium-dependent haloperoxidase [Nocardioides panacihumi]|uniref:Vanadium-dependent haloperoxidase n=1 Tax=Nocardioides panacihumi TaxID=400774 RepID=A0ABP5BJX2_9ACTN
MDAAVAAASYGVLHDILSTVPNVPDATRTTMLATLDTQYAAALAAVPDGRAETKGVAAGQAAAAAMIAAREDDGRFGPSPWVPSTAPGHWAPQLNAAGQPILDPTPWVGGVDPFVARSSSQFRTQGPLSLTSAQYAAEVNEVKTLGAINSPARSATQTYIARWWQSTPSRSWNEVGRTLSERYGLSALDTARLLALQDFSGADASINCWNDKYYWDFWRPWNAIPRAAEDGNPGTEPDPAWLPLISAPYPEHPSGHMCLDGSHTRILRMFFGDAPVGGFSITSVSTFLQPGDPAVRTFTSFSQVLDEIVEARIWAGLHYRNADLQGRALGTSAATYVASHALQPVGHHHHRHHHHHH